METRLELHVAEGSKVKQRIETDSAAKFRLAALNENVSVHYQKNGSWQALGVNFVELPEDPVLEFKGVNQGSGQVEILYQPLARASEPKKIFVNVNVIHLAMSLDVSRTGTIDRNNTQTNQWVWGSTGSGAIVLVNDDADTQYRGKSEYSEVLIHSTGQNLPRGYQIILKTTSEFASKFTLFSKPEGASNPEILLGKNPNRLRSNPITLSRSIADRVVNHDLKLYMTAWQYPDRNFDGLILFEMQMINNTRQVVASRQAAIRVAPWIMTPHTLPAEVVYASDLRDNAAFIRDLRQNISQIPNLEFKVIPPQLNRNDRWVQDEFEIGYQQGPTHLKTVVFDLPRNRELDDFPETLIGPDFGHFNLSPDRGRSSLESGGNLEVSPPVTFNGRHYPFGRITYGGGSKYWNHPEPRDMIPTMVNFLKAQQVQSPIELFTDWLYVGHVDEIVSFVPKDDDFVVAISSIDAAWNILRKLHRDNHSNLVLFKGMRRDGGASAEITVVDLLQDTVFWENNRVFQSYLDTNSAILKHGLGLTTDKFVGIPSLFHKLGTIDPMRTAAYFPGMVNHLVLGNTSLVPKPHGPKLGTTDYFEQGFKDALPWRNVAFIEDWDSYHELLGEVHCGSNVKRKPFDDRNWWSVKPDDAIDHIPAPNF